MFDKFYIQLFRNKINVLNNLLISDGLIYKTYMFNN
jgi:hypothetical protein